MGEDIKISKSSHAESSTVVELPRPKSKKKSLKLVLRPFDATSSKRDFDVAMIGVTLRQSTENLSVVMMPSRVRS